MNGLKSSLLFLKITNMLELRPNCENCDKSLPPESKEAMICTFECTFCTTCVKELLHNVCPNCSGGLVNRPLLSQSILKNSNHF